MRQRIESADQGSRPNTASLLKASGLPALLGCVPRQELIDAGDLAVGDAGQGIGEPGLGIDAIELGGLDQGAGDGGGAAAVKRPDEQIVLRADRNRSQPMATERIARSAVLLSSSRMPCSRYGRIRAMRVRA
jgi:hypothetical protein